MNTPDNKPAARVQRPERRQVMIRTSSLDELVPDDHRVRDVWAYVEALDLGPLYESIRAVEGSSGRDAVDPRILVALWLFATIEAISSARQLARSCERDIIYQWICGDVGVNHRLLSEFRTAHGDFFDRLLTNSIATLLHQQIVTLETVSQDGMRVRASAGSSSLRRKKSLRECQAEAAEQVAKLRDESDSNEQTDASNARKKAARERAVRERAARIEQAMKELEELEAQKESRKKGSGEDARCSTTDPEARTMKMANGGFRPAYNVQFVTDAKSRMITLVAVTNNGSDGGQLAPMHASLIERYGVTPADYLVDGGFTTHEDITQVEHRKTRVVGPIPKASKMEANGTNPHDRQPRDSDEMFAFRQRMATPDAKELYKQRSGLAELPNAECRNRGLRQFRVRGKAKVKAATLWYVLAFNLMRMLNLNCLARVVRPT